MVHNKLNKKKKDKNEIIKAPCGCPEEEVTIRFCETCDVDSLFCNHHSPYGTCFCS